MTYWWLNFLLINVILLIPIIGYWRLFEKAQEKGWKALIPFYNIFVFSRIIRRPAWWISLYLLVFIHPGFGGIIFGFDAWRCHTLFGMNVKFYSRKLLPRILLAPVRFVRIIVYAGVGYPHISFNRKVFYSTEYLGQLSKDKSAKELYDMQKKRNRGLLKECKEDYQMARPLGMPLFSYDLAKDNQKDEDLSWSQFSGAISWLGLFIYFWIADWGKPGFTDADLSKIHNPLGREALDFIQPEKNNTEDILFSDEISPLLDFIMDLLLYSLCSLIGAVIITYILNFIFRVFNNIYFKLN